MVFFIIAAAAAFLLCGPFAPETLSNWLKDNKHALRLFLFLFLLAAAFFILVAAAAGPREVGVVLLALPILSLILTMGSLLYGKSAGADAAGVDSARGDTAGAGAARVDAARVDAARAGSAVAGSPGAGSAGGDAPERAMQPAVVEWLHKVLSASGISWLLPAEPAPGPSAPNELPPMQPAVVEWLHNAPSRLGHFVAFVGGLVPLGLVVIAFLVPVALLVIPFGSFWFRPLAIGLASYTWLVGFHALLTRSNHPAFKWLGCEKWQARLILASLLFTAVLSTLIAWNGDAWAYAILLTSHRVASAPETVHALLGVIAGLMCANFSTWMDYARSLGGGKAATPGKSGTGHAASTAAGQTNERESASVDSEPPPAGDGDDPPRPPPPRTGRGLTPRRPDASSGKAASEIWPMIVFAVALSGVIVAALVAPPYEQSVLSHVSGVETPYLKVQFATSTSLADKQQILRVDRDLNIGDSLEAFPRTLRLIQYDCAQAAFNANVGIDDFRHGHPYEYGVFTAGLAFRENVIPYVNQLINARRRGDNLVVLKARARQVAEKFALLTSGDFENHRRAALSAFKTNFQDAMAEVDRQRQLFADEGVGDDLAAEERLRRRKDPDPDYCRPSDDDIRLASDRFDIHNIDNVRMVVQKRPRLILAFAAPLFRFAGNDSASDAIFASIFHLDPGTDDINVKGSRDATLYSEGGDLREVVQEEQKALREIEARLGKWERAKVWSEEEVKADKTGAKKTDNKIHSDLVARYNRARLQVRLTLAYVSAQHGLASEEDLLPERDLYWASAQKYVDDALESLLDRSKASPRFECWDDELDLTIKDTYGFVKLAYQAYTFKTQRVPPDQFQIRRARELLEEALAEAREQYRRLEEARPSMAQGSAAPSCLTEVATKAWVKRISGHLKLADALQP